MLNKQARERIQNNKWRRDCRHRQVRVFKELGISRHQLDQYVQQTILQELQSEMVRESQEALTESGTQVWITSVVGQPIEGPVTVLDEHLRPMMILTPPEHTGEFERD